MPPNINSPTAHLSPHPTPAPPSLPFSLPLSPCLGEQLLLSTSLRLLTGLPWIGHSPLPASTLWLLPQQTSLLPSTSFPYDLDTCNCSALKEAGYFGQTWLLTWKYASWLFFLQTTSALIAPYTIGRHQPLMTSSLTWQCHRRHPTAIALWHLSVFRQVRKLLLLSDYSFPSQINSPPFIQVPTVLLLWHTRILPAEVAFHGLPSNFGCCNLFLD